MWDAMVALFVVAVAMGTSAQLIHTYAQGHETDQRRHAARTLARGLMGEILARTHTGTWVNPVGSRLRRISVLDFDTLPDNPQGGWQSPLCDAAYYPVHDHVEPESCSADPAAGDILGERYQGYKRTVDIETVDVCSGKLNCDPFNLLEITVKVLYQDEPVYELSALKGRHTAAQ